MAVELSLHKEPPYNPLEPQLNPNLYLIKPDGTTRVGAGEDLEAGENYSLYVHVENFGGSTVLDADISFYVAEKPADTLSASTQIGSTIRVRMRGNSNLEVAANAFFVAEANKEYRFYAVATSPSSDPVPNYTNTPVDPTDRHVAEWDCDTLPDVRNVTLTLHDGMQETNQNYGHNPNLWFEDTKGKVYDSQPGSKVNIPQGTDVYIKARVVNMGTDDAIDTLVKFYEHSSGLTQKVDNPLAESETATVAAGGEHIFTSKGLYAYNHSNCMVAICESPDDMPPFDSTNAINASDRHVAQHNVSAYRSSNSNNIKYDGKVSQDENPEKGIFSVDLFIPQLLGRSFNIKRVTDQGTHGDKNLQTIIVDGNIDLEEDMDHINHGIYVDARNLMDRTVRFDFILKNGKQQGTGKYAIYAPEGAYQVIIDYKEA